jgi:hypothetical protein
MDLNVKLTRCYPWAVVNLFNCGAVVMLAMWVPNIEFCDPAITTPLRLLSWIFVSDRLVLFSQGIEVIFQKKNHRIATSRFSSLGRAPD